MVGEIVNFSAKAAKATVRPAGAVAGTERGPGRGLGDGFERRTDESMRMSLHFCQLLLKRSTTWQRFVNSFNLPR